MTTETKVVGRAKVLCSMAQLQSDEKTEWWKNARLFRFLFSDMDSAFQAWQARRSNSSSSSSTSNGTEAPIAARLAGRRDAAEDSAWWNTFGRWWCPKPSAQRAKEAASARETWAMARDVLAMTLEADDEGDDGNAAGGDDVYTPTGIVCHPQQPWLAAFVPSVLRLGKQTNRPAPYRRQDDSTGSGCYPILVEYESGAVPVTTLDMTRCVQRMQPAAQYTMLVTHTSACLIVLCRDGLHWSHDVVRSNASAGVALEQIAIRYASRWLRWVWPDAMRALCSGSSGGGGGGNDTSQRALAECVMACLPAGAKVKDAEQAMRMLDFAKTGSALIVGAQETDATMSSSDGKDAKEPAPTAPMDTSSDVTAPTQALEDNDEASLVPMSDEENTAQQTEPNGSRDADVREVETAADIVASLEQDRLDVPVRVGGGGRGRVLNVRRRSRSMSPVSRVA
jgi:hypothetical protein